MSRKVLKQLPAVHQVLDGWSALRPVRESVDGRSRCRMARWPVHLSRRYLSREVSCWKTVQSDASAAESSERPICRHLSRLMRPDATGRRSDDEGTVDFASYCVEHLHDPLFNFPSLTVCTLCSSLCSVVQHLFVWKDLNPRHTPLDVLLRESWDVLSDSPSLQGLNGPLSLTDRVH